MPQQAETIRKKNRTTTTTSVATFAMGENSFRIYPFGVMRTSRPLWKPHPSSKKSRRSSASVRSIVSGEITRVSWSSPSGEYNGACAFALTSTRNNKSNNKNKNNDAPSSLSTVAAETKEETIPERNSPVVLHTESNNNTGRSGSSVGEETEEEPMVSDRRRHGDAGTAISPEVSDDLARLRDEFPASTAAERERFLRAKNGNRSKASEQLRSHLDWRAEHGLDDPQRRWTPSLSSSSSLPDQHHHKHSHKILGGPSRSSSNNNNNTDEHTLEGSWTSSISSISSDDDDDDDVNNDHQKNLYSSATDEKALDELDWRFAAEAALAYERRTSSPEPTATRREGRRSNKNNNRERHDDDDEDRPLPQIARLAPAAQRDRGGHRILHFLPGQIDLTRASGTAFALSIALYLDRKLDRNSAEKFTVAIDVRGGSGWPNPNPTKLLPFLQQVSNLLERQFPERLARCLVYPVPAAASFLWRMVRRFLDPATAEKIDLVPGESRIVSPPPLAAMDPHVAPDVLEAMEAHRRSRFVVVDVDGGDGGGDR